MKVPDSKLWNQTFINRCGLVTGGYFISFQDGMTHEHTKPDTMLGHLADQLTAGFDFSLDQGAVAESALRCGFNWVRSRTMDTPMGPLDTDIARKLPHEQKECEK